MLYYHYNNRSITGDALVDDKQYLVDDDFHVFSDNTAACDIVEAYTKLAACDSCKGNGTQRIISEFGEKGFSIIDYTDHEGQDDAILNIALFLRAEGYLCGLLKIFSHR